MTIRTAIEVYTKVAVTLRAHAWRSWCNYYDLRWGVIDVEAIDAGEINTMIAERRRAGVTEATLHSQLHTLKRLFKTAKVAWPEDVARLGRANEVSEGFEERDEAALRRVMKASDFEIYELAVLTGLRGMELFLVEKTDVNLSGGWIDIKAQPGAKTGAGRAMLGPKARRLVKKMLAESKGSKWLVNPEGFEKWKSRRNVKSKWLELVFRPACRSAGVKKTFHQTRHSTASKMVRSGRSLYHVQLQLRQSSPRMAQRYAHLNNKDRQDSVRCL